MSVEMFEQTKWKCGTLLVAFVLFLLAIDGKAQMILCNPSEVSSLSSKKTFSSVTITIDADQLRRHSTPKKCMLYRQCVFQNVFINIQGSFDFEANVLFNGSTFQNSAINLDGTFGVGTQVLILDSTVTVSGTLPNNQTAVITVGTNSKLEGSAVVAVVSNQFEVSQPSVPLTGLEPTSLLRVQQVLVMEKSELQLSHNTMESLGAEMQNVIHLDQLQLQDSALISLTSNRIGSIAFQQNIASVVKFDSCSFLSQSRVLVQNNSVVLSSSAQEIDMCSILSFTDSSLNSSKFDFTENSFELFSPKVSATVISFQHVHSFNTPVRIETNSIFAQSGDNSVGVGLIGQLDATFFRSTYLSISKNRIEVVSQRGSAVGIWHRNMSFLSGCVLDTNENVMKATVVSSVQMSCVVAGFAMHKGAWSGILVNLKWSRMTTVGSVTMSANATSPVRFQQGVAGHVWCFLEYSTLESLSPADSPVLMMFDGPGQLKLTTRCNINMTAKGVDVPMAIAGNSNFNVWINDTTCTMPPTPAPVVTRTLTKEPIFSHSTTILLTPVPTTTDAPTPAPTEPPRDPPPPTTPQPTTKPPAPIRPHYLGTPLIVVVMLGALTGRSIALDIQTVLLFGHCVLASPMSKSVAKGTTFVMTPLDGVISDGDEFSALLGNLALLGGCFLLHSIIVVLVRVKTGGMVVLSGVLGKWLLAMDHCRFPGLIMYYYTPLFPGIALSCFRFIETHALKVVAPSAAGILLISVTILLVLFLPPVAAPFVLRNDQQQYLRFIRVHAHTYEPIFGKNMVDALTALVFPQGAWIGLHPRVKDFAHSFNGTPSLKFIPVRYCKAVAIALFATVGSKLIDDEIVILLLLSCIFVISIACALILEFHRARLDCVNQVVVDSCGFLLALASVAKVTELDEIVYHFLIFWGLLGESVSLVLYFVEGKAKWEAKELQYAHRLSDIKRKLLDRLQKRHEDGRVVSLLDVPLLDRGYILSEDEKARAENPHIKTQISFSGAGLESAPPPELDFKVRAKTKNQPPAQNEPSLNPLLGKAAEFLGLMKSNDVGGKPGHDQSTATEEKGQTMAKEMSLLDMLGTLKDGGNSAKSTSSTAVSKPAVDKPPQTNKKQNSETKKSSSKPEGSLMNFISVLTDTNEAANRQPKSEGKQKAKNSEKVEEKRDDGKHGGSLMDLIGVLTDKTEGPTSTPNAAPANDGKKNKKKAEGSVFDLIGVLNSKPEETSTKSEPKKSSNELALEVMDAPSKTKEQHEVKGVEIKKTVISPEKQTEIDAEAKKKEREKKKRDKRVVDTKMLKMAGALGMMSKK